MCVLCGSNFNPYSQEKKQSGGKYNHCPDCSEETAIKHLGVGDGCGKQTAVQILAFENKEDKASFSNYWRAATGMGTGKNSHMAYLPSPRKHKFKKICESGGNPNAKGKLD